jgi:hypothetical protein
MNSEIKKWKTLFGGKISVVNVQDANAKRQDVSSGDSYIYSVRIIPAHTPRKVWILVSGELGCISIFGNFDIPHFTMVSKDRSGFSSFPAGNINIGQVSYPVFNENGIPTESQNQILLSVELRALIATHEFRRGEALHFYRNCIVLYVRKEDISSELLQRMVGLANIIPSEEDLEDTELPSQFKHLEGILRNWAFSDDLKRSDKMQNASKKDLQKLVDDIEPNLDTITFYLNSVKEGQERSALANLARIVETGIEAKARLAGY